MMRNIKFIVVFLALGSSAHAQLMPYPSPANHYNAYIKNDYIQAAFAPYGVYGATYSTSICPGYYSPSNASNGPLGFICSPDNNWPFYYGDFMLPGDPHEAFSFVFTVNGTRMKYINDRSNGGQSGGIIPRNPAFVYNSNTGLGIYDDLTWYGQIPLYLDVTCRFHLVGRRIIHYTTVKNIYIDTIKNIYFTRVMDPDQENGADAAVLPIGCMPTTNTYNVIESQANGTQGKVSWVIGNGYCLPSSISLYSEDTLSRVGVHTSWRGLLNNPEYAFGIGSPPSDLYLNEGEYSRTVSQDAAIELTIFAGNLAPGDSITLVHEIRLDQPPVVKFDNPLTLTKNEGDTFTYNIIRQHQLDDTVTVTVRLTAVSNFTKDDIEDVPSLYHDYVVVFLPNDTVESLTLVASKDCANITNKKFQLQIVAVQSHYGGMATMPSVVAGTILDASPSLYAPTVPKPNIAFLQHSVASTLTTATGTIPTAGHSLTWYEADSTTLYADTAAFNTVTKGIFKYWVSQTNDTTHCESQKVPVTVIVVKPTALSYVSCPGAEVTVSVDTITGVSFYWYTLQAGGSLLTSNSNTHTVTSVAPPVTVWVEPRMSSVVYERVPITIELSASCGGTPVNCALNGTVIFREDFGGNSPSDPAMKPTGIPQVSSHYTYTTTSAGIAVGGSYTINKYSLQHPSNNWFRMDDHTYFNDITKGYLLQVNASAEKGQFYEVKIDDLCENMTLYFSAWLVSVINHTGGIHKTNQIFTLEDTTGTIIAQYNTGNIPDMNSTWKQYGFAFTVPAGITSLRLRILNNGAGSSGNDFVMDDIEIRLCAPPVTITVPSSLDTAICESNPITLAANYTDDGTFGNSLAYRWEYSLTGDINNPSAWTTKLSGTATSPLNLTYPIASISASDTGFYRLIVSTPSSINNPNCRAMSAPIQLKMNKRPTVLITVGGKDTAVCSNSTVAFNLTTMATATGGGDSLQFSTSKTFAPLIGTITSYTVSSGSTATVYVRSLNKATGCYTKDEAIDSIKITVSPTKPVSIAISASDTTACAGEEITFNVISTTNAGTTPVYVWKKNISETIGSGTSLVYVPSHGDIIHCQLTSNAVCATPVPATSNNINITIIPKVVPSITIEVTN